MLDADAISKQAQAVNKAQSALEAARQHLRSVRALNGQSGYSVTIGGRSIAVATMDMRTYNAVLLRGMEMIHLGALKALAGEIRLLEMKLQEEEQRLANLVQAKP